MIIGRDAEVSGPEPIHTARRLTHISVIRELSRGVYCRSKYALLEKHASVELERDDPCPRFVRSRQNIPNIRMKLVFLHGPSWSLHRVLPGTRTRV